MVDEDSIQAIVMYFVLVSRPYNSGMNSGDTAILDFRLRPYVVISTVLIPPNGGHIFPETGKQGEALELERFWIRDQLQDS